MSSLGMFTFLKLTSRCAGPHATYTRLRTRWLLLLLRLGSQSLHGEARARKTSGIELLALASSTVDQNFRWCIERTISAESWQPNMILDDGGDATHVMVSVPFEIISPLLF